MRTFENLTTGFSLVFESFMSIRTDVRYIFMIKYLHLETPPLPPPLKNVRESFSIGKKVTIS
jgi:hypothetical protein